VRRQSGEPTAKERGKEIKREGIDFEQFLVVELRQEGVVVPFVFRCNHGGIDVGCTSKVVLELEVLGGASVGVKLQVENL